MLNERIKQLRALRGLSLDELSYEARVPTRTLYNWESGASSPCDLDALARLAAALDTTTDYLISGRTW